MTRTAGALIGRRRSSAFWGLGCPKTHHEIKDSLAYYGGITGWVLKTPDVGLEVFQAKMPDFLVLGGIHIFSQDTVTTKPAIVPKNVEFSP
ncbi:MAG: hypothetical protein ABW170_13920 [Candidatus Thiodiazotropha sp. L084R]